ncbi:hypothetical protein VTK73DRAFT_6055 [Phialemonium thermophilum]|uniref:Protein kinase domain-containing protein n=1 Tax=Phialemonium thermophilum TaxID=223376 RepID=A0ABR3XXD7_9PEZI
MSVAEMRKTRFDGHFPIDVVKGLVFYILRGLDFLHRKANLVHADIQEDNILLSVENETELREVEEEEMSEPSPRKVYKDHTIYASTLLQISGGEPVLCDFGEARFGQASYDEHALPDLYRAPEILLGIEWTEKIDIWTLGLVMWTMVEGTNLFTDNKGGRWKSALPHMARMISLLGPPPQDLLDGAPDTKKYFKNGRFKKADKVTRTSLEEEATILEGDEKAAFLRFLRRLLQWRASDRPSALELLKDPWLQPPTTTDD